MADILMALKKLQPDIAIKSHFIVNSDEFTRELYITFLIAIANEIGITEERLKFLKALAKGLNIKDFTNCQKKALEINESFFDNVIKTLKHDNILKYFLIDALILANINSDFNENTAKLLSKIFELFEVNEHLLKEIIDKSKFVLTEIDEKDYLSYPEIIRDFIQQNQIIDSEKKFKGYSKVFYNCEIDFRKKGRIIFETENVKFLNCILLGCDLIFSGCSNVQIIDCKIEGHNKKYLNIEAQNCENIVFKNVEFENFKIGYGKYDIGRSKYFDEFRKDESFLSNFKENKNIFFENCKFLNISSDYSGKPSFIYITDVDNIRFYKNAFDKLEFYYLFYFYQCESLDIIENSFKNLKTHSESIEIQSMSKANIRKNNFEDIAVSSYSYFVDCRNVTFVEFIENILKRGKCDYDILYIDAKYIKINDNEFNNWKISRGGRKIIYAPHPEKGEILRNKIISCSYGRFTSDLPSSVKEKDNKFID